MISHHRERGKDNGLDRVSENVLTYLCRRNRKIQYMVTPESDDEISGQDFTIVDSSSPSAKPLSSAEQRNRSRRSERSRSRERVYPRSSSHASQQQPVVPLPLETQATQSEDENSTTMEPQKIV